MSFAGAGFMRRSDNIGNDRTYTAAFIVPRDYSIENSQYVVDDKPPSNTIRSHPSRSQCVGSLPRPILLQRRHLGD
jgi:hypothetical protein